MSENMKMEVLLGEENTKMMAEKFPVIYPTPVDTDMEKKIQNRLLNGFENWNRGFDAWKEWGDVLYTDASIYNVHAVKLTLANYQMAMMGTLKRNKILMGDFMNMLIVDDWTAIHYKIATENPATGEFYPGSVMEFVKFADLGEELGARVVEGWAGTRGDDFAGLSMIQAPACKEAQDKVTEEVLNTVIPDTDDLVAKYPVKFPTTIKNEMGLKIRDYILAEFDAYNKGYEAYAECVKANAAEGFKRYAGLTEQSADEYLADIKADMEAKDTRRVFFDSMIISGNCAAIHYRTVVTDKATGERIAADVMEHIHFANDGDSVKATTRWTS